jgi:hypothetical protein
VFAIPSILAFRGTAFDLWDKFGTSVSAGLEPFAGFSSLEKFVRSATGNRLGACDFFHQYWENPGLSRASGRWAENEIPVEMANFTPV